MSKKKMDSSSSTVKRKTTTTEDSSSTKTESASARSTKKALPTAGKPRLKKGESKTRTKNKANRVFSDLGLMIKEARNYTDLAVPMHIVRMSSAVVGHFNFQADAQFYRELGTAPFETVRKTAHKRFSEAQKARVSLLPYSQFAKARKAYSAALQVWQKSAKRDKSLKKSELDLIERHLAHYGKLARPTVNSPFGEVYAENPFDPDGPPLTDEKKSGKLGKSKKRRV